VRNRCLSRYNSDSPGSGQRCARRSAAPPPGNERTWVGG
jgi:hypothetical protein